VVVGAECQHVEIMGYIQSETLPQHDKGIGHLHRDLVVCNLW